MRLPRRIPGAIQDVISAKAGIHFNHENLWIPAFAEMTGLKKAISMCSLPSLAVNISHTLLQLENSVFRAENACVGRYFLQLAGQLNLAPLEYSDGTKSLFPYFRLITEGHILAEVTTADT